MMFPSILQQIES